MLWTVMVGLLCIFGYVIFCLNADPILVGCYSVQALCWGTVMKYKYFERKYRGIINI